MGDMSNNIPAINAADVPTDAVILDVREDNEWSAGHATGASHIPLGQLEGRLAEVPKASPLYVICRSGGRSMQAANLLAEKGHEVTNVTGGTQAWAQAGKPMSSETGGEPTVA